MKRSDTMDKMEEVPQELSFDGEKKIRRRVSFSLTKHVREYPKYLNNTDSSSECNSDANRTVEDASTADTTLADCVDMSLCENSLTNDSFLPGSDHVCLSDITRLVLDGCLPGPPRSPLPIVEQKTTLDGNVAVGGEPFESKAESSIPGSISAKGSQLAQLLQSGDSTHYDDHTKDENTFNVSSGENSKVGRLSMPKFDTSSCALASDSIEVFAEVYPPKLQSDFKEPASRYDDDTNVSKVDISIPALAKDMSRESGTRASGLDEESPPKFFPSAEQSLGLAELSRTTLCSAVFREPDESGVVDPGLETASRVDLSLYPSRHLPESGGLCESGLRNILPLDNTLFQFSMDHLDAAFDEDAEGTAKPPLEASVMDPSSGPVANPFLPLPGNSSNDLSEFLVALERARQAALDEPVDIGDVWTEEFEEAMTSHRKDFDLMEYYKELIKEEKDLLDMTDVDFESHSEEEGGDGAEESVSEGDWRGGADDISVEDMEDWLAQLKRKFHMDDKEIVEETYVCSSTNCHSIIVQFWTTVFDHLASSSNKNFQRCLDSLTTSKKHLEKSYKVLQEEILEAIEKMDSRPDRDSPVVMVTRKKKLELQEKSSEFYQQVWHFAGLMMEYLDYDVRSVDETDLFVYIHDSWVVKFLFDQSAARLGVVKVAGVESRLLSRIRGRVHDLIGEPRKVRIESELEHLLGDFLSSESLLSKVDNLTSIVKILDQMSLLYSEASCIVDFMDRVNPLRVEEFCYLAGNVLTYSFFEPASSLHFSISTDEFKLPSLCSSAPKWKVTKHCGWLREAELRFAVDSVKFDSAYFQSVYESIRNWLKGFPGV